jgi:hypothetical protein
MQLRNENNLYSFNAGFLRKRSGGKRPPDSRVTFSNLARVAAEEIGCSRQGNLTGDGTFQLRTSISDYGLPVFRSGKFL